MRYRLSDEELFRVGPNGLEDISDETLEMRVEEILKHREELNRTLVDITLSQMQPLERV